MIAKPGALTEERRKTHGDWPETARIADELCAVIAAAQDRRRARGQPQLKPHQLQALVQDQFKTARILAGDPDFPDHWDDKAGYAWLGKGAGG